MSRTLIVLVATALAATAMIAGSAAAQPADPALGKRLWVQCRACHTAKADEPSDAGPNLHGVFGAKAGSKADFDYSPALKGSGVVWTDAMLDAFIAAPAKTIRGNRMGFAGMADPAQRQALIAFLKTETR